MTGGVSEQEREKERITAAIRYVVDEVLACRPLRNCSIAYGDIRFGRSRQPDLYLTPSGFFGQKYGHPSSLPPTSLPTIEDVPLLYGTPIVRKQGNRFIIHADIIASTYFMVTRYEEIVRREVRDEHGRFPGKESLAYRAGFIDRPIIEEYGALLRKWLRAVGVVVPEPKRRFSLLLTHDVDFVRLYGSWHQPYRAAAAALLGRNPRFVIGEALGCAWGFRKDPWDTFNEMIRLDRTVGEETVYFFMAGGKSPYDARYDIRGRHARRAIDKVRRAGASIGLHASYEAGLHPELIAHEKARLEKVSGLRIRRNRHHYLAWREVEDGWQLAEAGIDWDATLGYPDVGGFRLGVCHPIPLFDPVKMQPMGIEEHPLILMDRTLSNADYMGLSEEEAFSHSKKLVDETRKHGGELVMLWHNNLLAHSPGNYHPRLYRGLLSYAARLAAR